MLLEVVNLYWLSDFACCRQDQSASRCPGVYADHWTPPLTLAPPPQSLAQATLSYQLLDHYKGHQLNIWIYLHLKLGMHKADNSQKHA